MIRRGNDSILLYPRINIVDFLDLGMGSDPTAAQGSTQWYLKDHSPLVVTSKGPRAGCKIRW